MVGAVRIELTYRGYQPRALTIVLYPENWTVWCLQRDSNPQKTNFEFAMSTNCIMKARMVHEVGFEPTNLRQQFLRLPSVPLEYSRSLMATAARFELAIHAWKACDLTPCLCGHWWLHQESNLAYGGMNSALSQTIQPGVTPENWTQITGFTDQHTNHCVRATIYQRTGGRGRIRTCEAKRRLIYSQLVLTTYLLFHIWHRYEDSNPDLGLRRPLLYPVELYRYWRRVRDLNSCAGFLRPNGLANRPLQPLG